MEKKREDRRSAYSKKAIRQSLLALMEDKPLNKITVREICERAQVNRSTFYAHYRHPIALYKILEQSMTEKMIRHFDGLKNKSISYMDLLRHYLEYCYDNSNLFLALYKTDSESLKRSLLELASSYDFFANTIPDDEKTYIIDYHINGSFSMIARWLREDHTKSVEDIAKLIYRLTKRQR